MVRLGEHLLNFAPVIICLEPGLLSPHTGVGRLLQPIKFQKRSIHGI